VKQGIYVVLRQFFFYPSFFLDTHHKFVFSGAMISRTEIIELLVQTQDENIEIPLITSAVRSFTEIPMKKQIFMDFVAFSRYLIYFKSQSILHHIPND
jgi:hypothetical protein